MKHCKCESENINNCADITEMIYLVKHPEEQDENTEENIKYDTSFLIDLALATRDEEWFNQLT